MRLGDPNGRYKPHAKHPHLMIKADADEPGEYRLLGIEGYDNDGDGRVNEDGDGYYDPNRNWPWNWQPEYAQRGSGRYPLSIAENRMVAEFILKHPNIAAGQSFHNAGGMILRGPGQEADAYDADDTAVFDTIGRRGELLLPGYRYVIAYKDLYPVYGGEFDWLYKMRGVAAFVNEMFTSEEYFGKASQGEGFFGSQEQIEAFDEYLLFGQGTIPWRQVDHPQYGRIEVGGLKKQWTRQPPSFLIEESLHRNMAFILYHADQMPLVEVQSVKSRPLAGGLTEVTATIANKRLMPTRLAVDLNRRITPPDLVAIRGRKLNVVAGLWSEDPFFTQSHEQKKRPEELRIASVPGMEAVYVRWIVRGSTDWTVSVESVKGGRHERRSQTK
jgi:hypothetical protein